VKKSEEEENVKIIEENEGISNQKQKKVSKKLRDDD